MSSLKDHASREVVVGRLSKTLAGHQVLQEISFEVDQGEYFVLLGPSGAGKSTLLKLIAGHGQPTGGQIFLCGKAADRLSPAQRPTSLMFQEYSLFDHMSNWENILFPLRVRKVLDEAGVEYATKLISKTGLTEKELMKSPREISGGERQRVALVRALVWKPRILLLDEPLASIDPTLRSELRLLLKELALGARVTTVHVTHSLDEAFELADRVGLLLEGRLAQVGSPTDLYSRPRSLQVASFLGYVCVNLAHEVDVSGPVPAEATTVAVPPAKLLAQPSTENGPALAAMYKGRVVNPDGSGDYLLIEVPCAVTGRKRTAWIPAGSGGPAWRTGQSVTLSCDWSHAVSFDGEGRAIGR